MPDTDVPDEMVASSPEGQRDQALRRLKKRRDLHKHAFSYIALNALLWSIWAIMGVTSHSWYPWPLWVTLGWGIGLTFYAWDVYFRRPITEDDIRTEMQQSHD